MHRPRLALALLGLLAFALPAFAGESRPAVAAPGPCAEPRIAADTRRDDFAVAGPVSALFDPVDVAASPADVDAHPRIEPPTIRPLTRPGSCDQPGSGCGVALSTRPQVVVPPVVPGVRPPRVP